VTREQFDASLSLAAPPDDCPPLLVALWHDRRGEWDEAHRVAQDIETTDAAWVHAYLHRKEGDLGNAAYWYRHAGKPVANGALDVEWSSIVDALVSGFA
jgi:hypothetical protein